MVKKKEEKKEEKKEILDLDEETIIEDNNKETSEALELKDREIEELNSRLLRLQADFVNFRKRVEKEKESTITYALECIITDILPIIDNFQRAIESEKSRAEEDSFYLGIEMIYQQLLKLLKDNGVDEIKSLNEDFDPNFHHAVFMEESKEYDSGKITEVLQKGYILKDKVIRPTMVKVAK